MTIFVPAVRSVLIIRAVTVHRLEDHYSTAAEALEAHIARLRASQTPFTRDGSTITFTDQTGALVTLTFEEI